MAIKNVVAAAAKGKVKGKIHANITAAANITKNDIIISIMAPKNDFNAKYDPIIV